MSWTTNPTPEPETISEPPKKKHRARRKKSTAATGLLDALKFLKNCQKKSGTVQENYCCMSANWAAASNGIVTIGTKIHENLEACPQTFQLEEALKEVGDDLSMTQLSDDKLCVTSGDFRALVPCVELEALCITEPDPNIAEIDERLRVAMVVTAPLADEKSDEAQKASLLVQSGSIVGTNYKGLIEYWHGIDLPQMLVPKVAIKAILKTKKRLTGFGYSGTTATFWFEDESYIKTKLYEYRKMNYECLFNYDESLLEMELPIEFFKAVKALEPFLIDGTVCFKDVALASDELEEGSSYKLEGLPEGLKFKVNYLKLFEKNFTRAIFDSEKAIGYFYGENCRGVLRGVTDE
jgi:hypothetical protein